MAHQLHRDRQLRVGNARRQPFGELVDALEQRDVRRVQVADLVRERQVLADVAVDRARDDAVGADHVGDERRVQLVGEAAQQRPGGDRLRECRGAGPEVEELLREQRLDPRDEVFAGAARAAAR